MSQIDVMKHARKTFETISRVEGREGRSGLVMTCTKAIAELDQAIEQAEKMEPFEVEWPDYHTEAMGCGLEDRNITDRYEAMQYGWDQALERVAERLPEKIYTLPPTALAEIDFLQHDDHLHFIQRVLESDSPKSDRDEAAQMVRDIRRSIRPPAPAQQPLTVDQVHKGLYNDFKESSKNMRDAYFAGICFAEKHHGITGETK